MSNQLIYSKQFLRVNVEGIPAPKGSKRVFRNGGMVEQSPRLKEWDKAVDSALSSQHSELYATVEGQPVAIELRFIFPRPKSRKVELWHTVRPDADKLARAVLDSLTRQAVIGDDSQVARLVVEKVYSDSLPSGVTIEGWLLP